MATSRRSKGTSTVQSTLFAEEPPARRSVSQDSVEEWMMTAATSPSSFAAWLAAVAPAGSFGKTYPVCFRLSMEGCAEALSCQSSGRLQNSGMAFAGMCMTLSTSEWNHTLTPSHNVDVVCSLSDILETGDHLRRYALSPKACAGIIRRAETRGKRLPEHLARALKAVAGLEPTLKRTGD